MVGPIVVVLIGTATVAIAAGLAGDRVARRNPGLITHPGLGLPPGREPAFVAVAASHAASLRRGHLRRARGLGLGHLAAARVVTRARPGRSRRGPGKPGHMRNILFDHCEL
jgi:hypothetical protein